MMQVTDKLAFPTKKKRNCLFLYNSQFLLLFGRKEYNAWQCLSDRIGSQTVIKLDTVWTDYGMVNYTQNTDIKYPIAHPWQYRWAILGLCYEFEN